jgi:hypothetical protein
MQNHEITQEIHSLKKSANNSAHPDPDHPEYTDCRKYIKKEFL